MNPPLEVVPNVPPTWPGITPAGEVVARFLACVRTTGDAQEASAVTAPLVRCHQVASEACETIERTPSEYARTSGTCSPPSAGSGTRSPTCSPTVTVSTSGGARTAITSSKDGSPGSSRPVRDVGSAVYRVEDGPIAEYWIQLDRLGLQLQLAEVATAGEPIAVSFT